MRFVYLYFCQRSTPSFLGFGSLYFSNINSFLFWGLPVCTLPDIDSFLFGVCPSILRQISTSSFLPEIARCSSVPLCHNPIFHLVPPLGRDVLGQEAGYLLGCQRRAGSKPLRLGQSMRVLLLEPGWSRPFSPYWPGCTRPYTNTSPPRLVVNKVHKRLWCVVLGNGAEMSPTTCVYATCFNYGERESINLARCSRLSCHNNEML